MIHSVITRTLVRYTRYTVNVTDWCDESKQVSQDDEVLEWCNLAPTTAIPCLPVAWGDSGQRLDNLHQVGGRTGGGFWLIKQNCGNDNDMSLIKTPPGLMTHVPWPGEMADCLQVNHKYLSGVIAISWSPGLWERKFLPSARAWSGHSDGGLSVTIM